METNSYNHNWEKFDTGQLIGGKTSDGVAYLELFLIDYQLLFNVKANAGCLNCIATYLHNYKQEKFKMENKNNSKYRLKEKYNGIPLEFGSSVFVNNANITDEYAIKIINNYQSTYPEFKKSDLFELYPLEEEKLKDVVVKPIIQARDTEKDNPITETPKETTTPIVVITSKKKKPIKRK